MSRTDAPPYLPGASRLYGEEAKELAALAPVKEEPKYRISPHACSRQPIAENRTPSLWQNKTQTAQTKVGVEAQGCRRRHSVYSSTKKAPSFSTELAELQQEFQFEQPEPDVEKEELRAEMTWRRRIIDFNSACNSKRMSSFNCNWALPLFRRRLSAEKWARTRQSG
jgi:hypothetical protein